jgi:hypothetical protein
MNWDLVEGDDIYPYCEGFSNDEYKNAREFLEIKDSTIPGAGRGLFPRKRLEEGTSLGFYSGKMLSKREHENMRLSDSSYVVTLHWKRKVRGKRQHIIVDGNVSGNMLSIINDGPHSGHAANVEMDDGGVLYTTRVVEEGEELFWNYGNNYWEPPDGRMTRRKKRSRSKSKRSSSSASSDSVTC